MGTQYVLLNSTHSIEESFTAGMWLIHFFPFRARLFGILFLLRIIGHRFTDTFAFFDLTTMERIISRVNLS